MFSLLSYSEADIKAQANNKLILLSVSLYKLNEMKKETKMIIQEMKNLNEIVSLNEQNYILLDDYFKYSGMVEVNSKLVSMTPLYRQKDINKVTRVYNDMSKYKLKDYRKYE